MAGDILFLEGNNTDLALLGMAYFIPHEIVDHSFILSSFPRILSTVKHFSEKLDFHH